VIGYDLEIIIHSTLIGSAAILTLGPWASKIAQAYHDPSSNGTKIFTTI